MLTFGRKPYKIVECNGTGKFHVLTREVKRYSKIVTLKTSCGIKKTMNKFNTSGYGWNLVGKEFEDCINCKKCKHINK